MAENLEIYPIGEIAERCKIRDYVRLYGFEDVRGVKIYRNLKAPMARRAHNWMVHCFVDDYVELVYDFGAGFVSIGFEFSREDVCFRKLSFEELLENSSENSLDKWVSLN